MANIEKKSYGSCSYTAKRIIHSINNWLEKYPTPILVYDVNPSVNEACEAIKFIIDTGRIGNIIYAKKMVYISPSPYKPSIFSTKIGLAIATNENDFIRLQEDDNTYYQFIDSFPEIIGVPIFSSEGNKKNDGDIYLKYQNTDRMSKQFWDKNNDNELKKDDRVILYFNVNIDNTLINPTVKHIGIYNGETKISPDTEQILYGIETNVGKMFLPHGINTYTHHFITFPEYNMANLNLIEANGKSLTLFNKYNENISDKKNIKNY